MRWRVLWNKGILTSVSSGALWVFRVDYSLNCIHVDTGACTSTGPRLHEFHATKNIHSPAVGPKVFGLIHPTVRHMSFFSRESGRGVGERSSHGPHVASDQ